MKATTSRSAALGGIGLVVAFLVSACFAPPVPTPPVLTPIETAPPLPTGDAYFDQVLEWKSCGGGVECATVTAPLDWSDPSRATVSIAVARAAASGEAQGSLLVNPGGPGASGVDLVLYSSDYIVSPEVREAFDLVGWDPRGVGRSTPVKCLDGAEKDELIFGDWENDYDSPAWIAELEAVEKRFVAACENNSGAILEFVDAESNARDMDLLRHLLGDDKLNYLGFSYGTYFGTMFAELFPERVGRLVLDGALDPTVGPTEWFAVQMAGFDSAMEAYLASCIAATECPFAGPLDTAKSEFGALMGAVGERELAASDGRILDSATLGSAIATALYSIESWPSLSRMLSDVERGDAALAFEFADSYYERSGDDRFDSNSFEVYTAALCLDNDFAAEGVSVAEGLNRIADVAPLVGREFALDDYGHIVAACSAWPFPAKVKPAAFDGAGADPILVIGTTNDPATPYSWAQALASQLESGVLVTFNGEGHTAYGRDSCVDAAVDAYLLDGVVPTRDPNC